MLGIRGADKLGRVNSGLRLTKGELSLILGSPWLDDKESLDHISAYLQASAPMHRQGILVEKVGSIFCKAVNGSGRPMTRPV